MRTYKRERGKFGNETDKATRRIEKATWNEKRNHQESCVMPDGISNHVPGQKRDGDLAVGSR